MTASKCFIFMYFLLPHHMAQLGTDQHESKVTVRETTCRAGAAADLPVQPLNDIVGADASSVFAGEIAAGESLLNAILHLFDCLLQFHRTKFFYDGFGFLPGSFFVLLGVNCLSILVTSFTLERGVTENTLILISNHQLYPVQATAAQPLEEADPACLILSHALCSA